MITGLDHVVVLTSDIEAGSRAYQTLLGCAPSWRSKGDGAARALFTLDNTTLFRSPVITGRTLRLREGGNQSGHLGVMHSCGALQWW